MRAIYLFLLALLLAGCSCENNRAPIRLGVDPNWAPLDFGPQTVYVNGFAEELLLEIAKYNGLTFEKITANREGLLDGLKQQQYDAVLTSLPPYEFNTAKYDFSQNFLDVGPVLIVSEKSDVNALSKLEGKSVGLIADDPVILELQKHPYIVLRNYTSIPDLLNGVVSGEVEGAMLDRIPAVNYVSDLYAGQLKIIGNPFMNAGLHMIALKGKQQHLVNTFNKSLEQLQKKKRIEALQKKWQL